MKNILLKTALSTALLLNHAKADDFLIGTRGPTNFQLDTGVIYTHKESAKGKSESIVNGNVLKYWTGNKLGFFGIASLPYKHVESNGLENSGLGDFTLKIGLRGSLDFGKNGSFHWIGAVGGSLPLGDADNKPALGSGSYDFKGGFTTTYLSSDKMNEITSAFEYTRPSIDKSTQTSDEIGAGFIIGRKIDEVLRIGAGLRGNAKLGGLNDGDYVLKARALMRYTFPKQKMMHLELICDKSIAQRKMPEEVSTALLFRYNF